MLDRLFCEAVISDNVLGIGLGWIFEALGQWTSFKMKYPLRPTDTETVILMNTFDY